MKYLTIAAIAGLLSQVNAECANACSGNGECGPKDQCICYDGFQGNDCSLRVCPSGLAFVDVPNGDLNHDGDLGDGSAASGYSKVSWHKYPVPEYWPADNSLSGTIKAKKNEAHFYTECSGKGACDRSSGLCVCYDGYTGSACQRTTCPNDCSGKGTCRTVAEIAAGALNKKFVDSANGFNSYSGVSTPFNYRLYDADKNQACVCDAGYGGVDCSLRECPRGDDPLTQQPGDCTDLDCTVRDSNRREKQTFGMPKNSGSHTYNIVFTDFDGVEWTTDELTLTNPTNPTDAAATTNAAAIKAALEALPLKVVGAIDVTGKAYVDLIYVYTVEFKTLSGNVPEMKIVAKSGSALPLYQPSQPIQYFDALIKTEIDDTAKKFDVRIRPLAYQQYRDSELVAMTQSGSANTDLDQTAALKAGFAGVRAALYEAGGWVDNAGSLSKVSPVDVLQNNNEFIVVFKAKDGFANGAKNLGSNPIYITTNSGAKVYKGTVLSRDGTTEHSVCSNRGLCDSSSGQCSCFSGYSGAACEVISALAQ